MTVRGRRRLAGLTAVLILAGACRGGDRDRTERAPGADGGAAGGDRSGASDGVGGGTPGRATGPGGTTGGSGRTGSPGGAAPGDAGLARTGAAPAAAVPAPGPPPGAPARPPGWRTIAPAPLKGRHSHSAVWTGREMIVWGGANRLSNLPVYQSDGAAYDPVADRWRPIAPSPLAARADHFAAWTGREMIVWGGDPGTATGYGNNQFVDGAAYDPATDRWRPLARFPLARRYGARAVWTGARLLVWGGANAEEGAQPPPLADGALYDPATDRWAVLPKSPLRGRLSPLAAATAAGDVLLSWGFTGRPGQATDSARYDGAWRAAAAVPEPATAWCFDLAGCVGVDTGPRLVFAGEGLAYDEAADRWSPVAPSPFADPFVDGKATAWTGSRILVWGGARYDPELEAPPDPKKMADGGAAYDPAGDRWEPLPAAPLARRARTRGVWTGAEFLVWGGESGFDQRIDYADGAAWSGGR